MTIAPYPAFSTLSQTEMRALEARLGARLAAALSIRAEQIPPDIAERLRFGRTQALARAHATQPARKPVPAAGGVVVGSSRSGSAFHAGFVPVWQRMAGLLPLLMLVAGLVAIDQWSVREQVVAVADVDAQLLSDQLPPAAYSDPGFVAFLRTAPLP